MRADLVSSLVRLVNPKTQHYTLLVMFCANLFFIFFYGGSDENIHIIIINNSTHG